MIDFELINSYRRIKFVFRFLRKRYDKSLKKRMVIGPVCTLCGFYDPYKQLKNS